MPAKLLFFFLGLLTALVGWMFYDLIPPKTPTTPAMTREQTIDQLSKELAKLHELNNVH